MKIKSLWMGHEVRWGGGFSVQPNSSTTSNSAQSYNRAKAVMDTECVLMNKEGTSLEQMVGECSMVRAELVGALIWNSQE